MSTPEEDEKKLEPFSGWRDTAAMVVFKLCDSVYMPWLLAAGFLLGVLWLLTRNLESKDALMFLRGIDTLHGMAWLGWIVALAELPLLRWMMSWAGKRQSEELTRLNEEVVRARNLLRNNAQMKLELELEKSEERANLNP